MSKRKHRNRQEARNSENIRNQQQSFNNNPFGINPNQLLSMFGNIDMSQINNMLQSMNADGLDFNNLNLGPLQNIVAGLGGRPQQQVKTQQPKSQQNENSSQEKKSESNSEDENIQMLISLRNFVSEERVEFIDKIIKLYNEGVFED